MRAVALRLRSEFRSAFLPRLGLALLIAVVGAVALTAAVSASRTGNVVDRFLDDQSASHLKVYCPGEQAACEEQVAGVPGVAAAAQFTEFRGYLAWQGANLQPTDDPCYSGAGLTELITSPEPGFGTEVNELRIVDGRAAAAGATDEVVIARELARRSGLAVGDQITVQLFAGADCGDPPSRWRPERSLRVVGVGVAPGEVRPESGEYGAGVHGTRALDRAIREEADGAQSDLVAVVVEPDADPDDVATAIREAGISDTVLSEARFFENVRRTVRPYAIAQWILAALVAAALLAVVGPLVTRQVRAEAGDHQTLSHLGMERGELFALGFARSVSIVVPAVVLASLLTIGFSAVTPVGLARVLEPSPGVRVDVAPLTLATVLLGAGFLALSLPAVWRVASPSAAAKERATTRPSRLAAFVARSGASPRIVTGVRMAFDAGTSSRSVPVRAGLATAAAAVLALTAVVTFGGSLDHLLTTPRLAGWNWDGLVIFDGAPPPGTDENELVALVESVEGVEAAGLATIFSASAGPVTLGPGDVEVATMGFDSGEIGPSVIEGRAPTAPGEILLGVETLDDLGLGIDDDVDVHAFSGTWEDGQRGTAKPVTGSVRIVGTGVIPAAGGEARLGRGAVMSIAGLQAINPFAELDVLLLRLDGHADDEATLRRLGEAVGLPRPPELGDEEEFAGDQLFDVRQVESLPLVLIVVLAVIAVGVVAHLVVTTMRTRRRELAVLRSLGFRPRDVRVAVLCQATASLVVTAAIGIPLGIALGRLVWRRFALSLGVVPEPVVPLLALAAVVGGLLVVANLTALLVTGRAHRGVAAELRAE